MQLQEVSWNSLLARLLLADGRVDLEALARGKVTAAELAEQYGHKDVAEIIREKASKPPQQWLTLPTREGILK